MCHEGNCSLVYHPVSMLRTIFEFMSPSHLFIPCPPSPLFEKAFVKLQEFFLEELLKSVCICNILGCLSQVSIFNNHGSVLFVFKLEMLHFSSLEFHFFFLSFFPHLLHHSSWSYTIYYQTVWTCVILVTITKKMQKNYKKMGVVV